MERLYSVCLRTQYALWILYALSLLILYALGFFIDLLNVRWLLIPATLGVLLVSILLSVMVVSIFLYEKVAKNTQTPNSPTFLGALPSVVILGGTIAYLF
jgi:hypothetical protein